VSYKRHKEEAERIHVNICLLITSDSIVKGLKRDEITPLLRQLISKVKGIELRSTKIVPNDPGLITRTLSAFLNSVHCDSVIVTGGTGISKRDVSVDVVKELCSKELPGYGELFRYLTYTKYGTIAIASRALACVSHDKLIFTTPGSPDAFKLAVSELILPEIKHLIYMLRYH